MPVFLGAGKFILNYFLPVFGESVLVSFSICNDLIVGFPKALIYGDGKRKIIVAT